nr:FKBP-type peptidyl-prolyl cis-trans isomerase [uncultured Blautia sp.]
MKKENRKLAQQRRAEERKKAAQKKKIKKILAYALPITAVVILTAVILADYVKHHSSNEQTTETQTTSQEENTEPALSTDTSLTVADGDTVNIDYVGSIDGVEFEGGNTNGKGTDLTIGSGLYIDDFEEKLIGAHPGDQVDVYATFPEDYGKEDLNGKEALFQVTINGIYQ